MGRSSLKRRCKRRSSRLSIRPSKRNLEKKSKQEVRKRSRTTQMTKLKKKYLRSNHARPARKTPTKRRLSR